VAAVTQDAVHPEPVWRERSDFIIGAPLPEPGRSEQLWARKLGEHRFEVCCVPFFLYDVALGDVVTTDAAYDLVEVQVRSGRSVLRAWFGESPLGRAERDAVAADLAAAGGLLEWSSPNLLAVDAADAAVADAVTARLTAREDRGHLVFEVGSRPGASSG